MSRPGPGQVIDDKLDAAPDPPGWWCRPPRCSIVPAAARGMAAIGADEGRARAQSSVQARPQSAVPLAPVTKGLSWSLADNPAAQVRPHNLWIAQIPKLIVRLLSPILVTWDIDGMQRSRW
jgi:hypothetical protein